MRFYLGTHEAHWLRSVSVPLFISRRRLARYRRALPVAAGPWALDSGGFTELSTYGRWTVSAADYVAEVRRFSAEVGNMAWAAPQDWMCEPFMLAKTGLSIEEHQRRTVANFLELRRLAPDLPIIPALQGWTLADYQRCHEMYGDAGVDLATTTVGLGSVCRRQATNEIGEIVGHFHALGLRLHGFGCKAGAIERYGGLLESADSMAWSFAGRRRGTCDRKARCANCQHYAMEWRDRVLEAMPGSQVQMAMPV